MHSHAGAWERGEKQLTLDSIIMTLFYNMNTAPNAELDANANPFAVVVQAHLATRADPSRRLASKLGLTRRLYRRGWGKEDILKLYRFIDWVLTLPEELE